MKYLLSLLTVLGIASVTVHAHVATTETFVDDVVLDTATYLNDFNGNGVPDILEDFNGDGLADALQFRDVEWCWDADAGFRNIRGGSWSHAASYALVDSRLSEDPFSRFDDLGFRIVRNP